MKVSTEPTRHPNEAKYFDHPIDTLYDKKGEHLVEISRIIRALAMGIPEPDKDGFWELDMDMILNEHPEAWPPLNKLVNYIAECDSVIILLNDYQKIMVDFI